MRLLCTLIERCRWHHPSRTLCNRCYNSRLHSRAALRLRRREEEGSRSGWSAEENKSRISRWLLLLINFALHAEACRSAARGKAFSRWRTNVGKRRSHNAPKLTPWTCRENARRGLKNSEDRRFSKFVKIESSNSTHSFLPCSFIGEYTNCSIIEYRKIRFAVALKLVENRINEDILEKISPSMIHYFSLRNSYNGCIFLSPMLEQVLCIIKIG